MKDLMMRAIDRANLRGAQYADVRIVRTIAESLSVKNGIVDALNMDESIGFGVRVLAGGNRGAWGFASSRDLTADEVDRVTDRAFEIAKASALVAGDSPVDLGPPVASRG